MEELVARIAKIPSNQRIIALVMTIIILVLGTYFVLVGPKKEEIDRQEIQLKQLQTKLVQDEQIAQDLKRYKVEVERLKQQLNKALAELPNDAEIPELLQRVAGLVEQSDCSMVKFEPQAEVVEGFYARIPVKMSVIGNYHSVAIFFDKVSKLTRIVNVTNIEFKEPKTENKKVVLGADFLATTFKFVEQKDPAAGGNTPGGALKAPPTLNTQGGK